MTENTKLPSLSKCELGKPYLSNCEYDLGSSHSLRFQPENVFARLKRSQRSQRASWTFKKVLECILDVITVIAIVITVIAIVVIVGLVT